MNPKHGSVLLRTITTDDAHGRLLELARTRGLALSEMARCVLEAAVDGGPYT